jgi:hypothetical protein
MNAIEIVRAVGEADSFPTFLPRFPKRARRHAATWEADSFP